MSTAEDAPGNGATDNLFSGLFQAFAGASEAAGGVAGAFTSKPASALLLLMEAHVAMLFRGMRFLGRASLSSAAFGQVLASQLGAISFGQQDEAVRILLDEGAAQLREMGELAVQEAHALERLLGGLAQQLRRLEDDELDEPRRFARAKP
jgi:hypothetical protein